MIENGVLKSLVVLLTFQFSISISLFWVLSTHIQWHTYLVLAQYHVLQTNLMVVGSTYWNNLLNRNTSWLLQKANSHGTCINKPPAGVRATAERHIKETFTANIRRFKQDKSRRVNRSSLSELFISFLAKVTQIINL